MTENNDFYTETMAKVYTDQGYLEKAAKIYRYLLGREPDRQDLAGKLLEIEKQINGENHTGKTYLVSLFSQWVDLVLKNNKLKKLKKVSKSVSSLSRHSSDE
jgi:hypothetical protein